MSFCTTMLSFRNKLNTSIMYYYVKLLHSSNQPELNTSLTKLTPNYLMSIVYNCCRKSCKAYVLIISNREQLTSQFRRVIHECQLFVCHGQSLNSFNKSLSQLGHRPLCSIQSIFYIERLFRTKIVFQCSSIGSKKFNFRVFSFRTK